MEKENDSQIQDAVIVAVSNSEQAPASPEKAPCENAPAESAPQPKGETAKPSETSDKESDGPKVIVKHERGVSHYVGFVLLTVLAICFFFIPGISLVYLVSCIAAITAPVAWIFAALLSVIVWFIFKLKIKGFKKSFLWYIGLCVLISAILISLSVLTSYKIFGGIFSLLVGGST